ncbi:MAG: hypothetical protein VKJ86_05285 [Synechococcus sp.]|nr:hypothetical protein [Synechococcus sp.]
MLQERLSPCETLLYHWLHFHQYRPDTLNLDYFRVWTAEFFPEAVTVTEVDRAICRLRELQLIDLDEMGRWAISSGEQPQIKFAPLPRKLWTGFWRRNLATNGFAIISAVVLAAIALALWTNAAKDVEIPDRDPTAEQIQQ